MGGTEQLGIVAQRQRDRETYGRFAYRAPFSAAAAHSIVIDLRHPEKRTITRLDPPPRIAKPEPKPERIPVPVTLRPCCSGNWRRLSDDRVQERVRAILRATAAAFEVGAGEMRDASRTRRLAYPRFAGMYLMRKVLRLSTKSIGRIFRRDHTTILAGLDRAAKLRRTDLDFRRRSVAIVTALRAGRLQLEAQQ